MIMSLKNKIWSIAQEANNRAGFTVDLKRMRRAADEGYCVAFSATQNLHGEDGLEQAMRHAQGPDGKGIIGGWHNADDEQFYFDSVSIYTTRVVAVEAAKVNRQIGIYDLRRREYVPIMENTSFNPSLAALRNRSHTV
jgi:fructokinase